MKTTSTNDNSALAKVTIGFELDKSWAEARQDIRKRTDS